RSAACHCVLATISSQSRSYNLANGGVYFALNEIGDLSGSEESAIAVAFGITVSKGRGSLLYGSMRRLHLSTIPRWTWFCSRNSDQSVPTDLILLCPDLAIRSNKYSEPRTERRSGTAGTMNPSATERNALTCQARLGG